MFNDIFPLNRAAQAQSSLLVSSIALIRKKIQMEHETDLYVACFYQKASVQGEFFHVLYSFVIIALLGADPKLHSYGTAKSGVGISAMSVLRPDLMMKCVVPVIMAGIIAVSHPSPQLDAVRIAPCVIAILQLSE